LIKDLFGADTTPTLVKDSVLKQFFAEWSIIDLHIRERLKTILERRPGLRFDLEAYPIDAAIYELEENKVVSQELGASVRRLGALKNALTHADERALESLDENVVQEIRSITAALIESRTKL
jgi:hypothetical protein